MSAEIRILVIASDPLARAGLASLLGDQTNLTIVGRVIGDAQLVTELDVYRADLGVWDLGWDVPNLDPSLLSTITEAGLPLLVLLPDPEFASSVWSAGVRGILLRDQPIERLSAAANSLAAGLIVLDPALADLLLPTAVPITDSTPIEPLTQREKEVLHLLAEGYSNKAIALSLSISEHTVKFHVNALMSKLNAQSRTEVVVRATRLGLITL